MQDRPERVSPLSAPDLLPWYHVWVLTCAALIVALPGLVMTGHAGAIAAMAGFMTAGYATSAAGARGAVAGGAGLLPALAIILIWPSLPVFAVVCAILCGVAGLEVARNGSRIAVMVLLGLTMTTVAIAGGAELTILAPMGVGLVAGHVAIRHLGLSGLLQRPPEPKLAALRLALFLCLGLAISLTLVMVIEEHRSYWIAILFLSRALVPVPDSKAPLLRYGKGAALGIALAVLVEAIAPPIALQAVIALTALVLGMRFMPSPRAVGPMMMTLAVLLGSAPTVAAALFRAEAIVIVFVTMLVVGLLLDRVWEAVTTPEKPRRSDAPHQTM